MTKGTLQSCMESLFVIGYPSTMSGKHPVGVLLRQGSLSSSEVGMEGNAGLL